MFFMDFRFGFSVASAKLFLVIVLCNVVIFCFVVLRMHSKASAVFAFAFLNRQKHEALDNEELGEYVGEHYDKVRFEASVLFKSDVEQG